MVNSTNRLDSLKDSLMWTAAGRGTVQDRITRDLKIISERLIDEYRPRAIILCGSFAKGEGSLLELGGELHYLSDCEMALLSAWPVARNRLIHTRQEISRQLGMDFELYHNFPLKYRSSFFSNLLYHPGFVSISMYDRRYSSLTLYGPDYTESMPSYEAQGIPPWEGMRQIWVRMLGAMEAYYKLDVTREKNELAKYLTAYRIHRLILACADALLLMSGEFHHSYRERARLCKTILSQRQAAILTKCPQLPAAIDQAITAKLRPNEMKIDDLKSLWQTTQEIADFVLRYLLAEEFKIEFDFYNELPARYLGNEKATRYFRPPGRFMQNARNAISLKKGLLPWSHLLLVSVPLLYFADRDTSLTDAFARRLQEFFGIVVQNKNDRLELIDRLVRLFQTMRV